MVGVVHGNENLGYEYTRDLCEAIATFTKKKVEMNAETFCYRSANLRYAVERDLYITCVNHWALFRAYSSIKQGRDLDELKLRNGSQVEVARNLLSNDYAGRMDISFILCDIVKCSCLYSVCRGLYKWCQRIFASKIYEYMDGKTLPSHPEILFYVEDEKFVRYCSSIVDVLPKSVAFFSASEKFNIRLFQHGYPSLLSFYNSVNWKKKKRQKLKKGKRHDFIYLEELFDKIYAIIENVRPRCVVVIEGNAPSDVVTNEVCKKLSIPVICIQQGWSPFVHNGFRNMSYTKMLVWGEGFADLLKPYNSDQDFVIVGNHILQELTMDIQNSSCKEREGVSFFLQSRCMLLSEQNHLEFINLAEWTADAFPDEQVLVREHPNALLSRDIKQRLLSHENIRITSFATHTLAEVFASSRVVVSVFSTTILEAIAVGVLPIVCNISELPRYFPDVDKVGAGIEVDSIEEAKVVIRRVLDDPSYASGLQKGMDSFRANFFNFKNPIEQIITEIVKVCNTK